MPFPLIVSRTVPLVLVERSTRIHNLLTRLPLGLLRILGALAGTQAGLEIPLILLTSVPRDFLVRNRESREGGFDYSPGANQ